MSHDEDILLSLPGDPEEAFVIYERHVRAQHLEPYRDPDDEHEASIKKEQHQQYLAKIAAFLNMYGFDVGVDFGFMYATDYNTFWQNFEEAQLKIQFFVTQCEIRKSQRIRDGEAAIYVLSPSQKQEIHHHLDQIRSIIAEADLTDEKREALSRRLNAFADEVDRDRTKGQILTAAYVWMKKEVKNEIGPGIDKVEKIFDVLAKAKELWETLPKPSIKKELPAPPKRIEGPKSDLDDDIPF